MRLSKLYFECHITIGPVFDDRRDLAQRVAFPYKFKLAKLLMRKGETTEDSKLDTFMTGHSVAYEDLYERMINVIKALKAEGFVIRRYKIEDTLLDSRPEGDPLCLL